MANKSIPELTDGVPAQSGDLLPISRSGANFKVTAASLAAAGALKTVQRTITSNEILNLATTPIEIVAPVAGQGIFITQAALTYIPGTTPYADPSITAVSTITSVDAPIVTTDTLTQVTLMGNLQPSWAGIVKYSGTLTADDSGTSIHITGFSNPSNNGTFPVLVSDYGSGNSYVFVLNLNAVAETHSGTLHRATAVYHGDNSSGSVAPATGFAIQGLANAGNNGILNCTAANATTMTFANISAVAETHAGTVVYARDGQEFVLYTPSSSLLIPYVLPFSAPFEPDPSSSVANVTAIAGTLDPKTCYVGSSTSSNVNGIGTSGQGLFFSIASNASGDKPPIYAGLPTAAQNLTGGDGTFQLTVSYLSVQTV